MSAARLHPPLLLSTVATVGLCSTLALAYYGYTQQAGRAALEAERDTWVLAAASSTAAIASTTAAASTSIASLQAEINQLQIENASLSSDLKREKNKNEDFEDQINKIAGTVGRLDKLSKTDEELLQKYSKVYFLNENYIPVRLSKIDSTLIMPGRSEQYFHTDALPFLEEMIQEAAEDGVELRVISAYRSFDQQADLKGAYTQSYGSGANTFSADQGYSEHQLGTTLDLADPATGGPYTSFEATAAFAWLDKNAYKYGFVLSYPKGNEYYVYEPWHWRFVGTDLARDLKREGATFYDWDQRTIDEYLISIFD